MKTLVTQVLDFTKVDALLEGFNCTTGFVTAILDLEGNILSRSGWRSVCTDFHRINPTTACNCTISDTILANKMAEGEKYHFYKCMNGLVDVAMPIVLNGEHVANLFSGQFFFEEPDMEFFRMQAKQYGFDEEKYLDALRRVPIVSEEKVKTAMDFLHQMTQFISERSLEKAQLISAKEKIEKSEEAYKDVVETTNDLITVVDGDGKIVFVNHASTHFWGLLPNECIGKSSFGFIHEEDREFTQKNFAGWIQSDVSNFYFENRQIGIHNRTLNVAWNVHVERFEGQIVKVTSIARDVTLLKEVERNLIAAKEKSEEGETLLNITNKIANVGGWEIKLKTNELVWTKQVYEIHEVDDDYVPTVESAIDFYDEKSAPIIQKAVDEAIASGKTFDVELKIITAKGNIKDVRAIGYIRYDDNNQAEYVYGSFQDITRQKKAENQLRKLSQAVEQSPASVVITDLKGNIEYVNPKFLEATGYSFEEVVGRNPRVLKSGEQSYDYYKNLWETISSGKTWQGEFHNKKKNGELYWESAQISPIKDENGKTINYLALKEDITEQKAMELQLNETMEQVQKYAKHLQKVREEEKALLAREIHDELGQLLVALKMDTGVTTTQYNKAESDEDKEKIKQKLAKHADMITKAISSARRIMYGLRPVKLEMLGFAGACEEYIEDFISRYEIECITDIDLNIEKLDEERSLAMYRILQETMMNVVKHAQATTIEIKYHQAGNDVVFEVKDNGVGFTVGKDGREDSYGLLGIKERITLLKGTLDIESSPGKGTRVVVRFPLG